MLQVCKLGIVVPHDSTAIHRKGGSGDRKPESALDSVSASGARRMKVRALGWGLFGAGILAVAMGAGLWTYGRFTLPQTTGTVIVSGPSAPIEIRRDSHAIPTIVAVSDHDAFFGLGYVHAQDRLFQMDLMRRLGSGRLSEAFGAETLSTDRFMRTLGLAQAARQSWEHLSQPTRDALQAYSDGVNAYLKGLPVLPPEFTVLHLSMQPWHPSDSLLWARLMALRLSGDAWDEALRARLLDHLPRQALDDLWPRQEKARSTIPATITPAERVPASTTSQQQALPSIASTTGSPSTLMALLDRWPQEIAPTLASNAWVVGAARSQSGKPILANDPHLSLDFPSQWYLAEIRTPNRTIGGATVPGVPFHLIGYNDKIAWGFTTTHSDTMDLVTERLAANGTYQTPQGNTPVTVRQEVISVVDGPDQTLTVRSTRHGPLIDDLLDAPGKDPDQAHALQATALMGDDRTADAFFRLNRATSVTDALAIGDVYGTPQQNFVIADDSGEMAYFTPGRVPLRSSSDGFLPASGADGRGDWTGWLPVADLPLWRPAPDQVIVTANNRPAPEAIAAPLSHHWPPSFRADRIASLLQDHPTWSARQMVALQGDTHSPLAQPFIDLLSSALAARPEGTSPLTGQQKTAFDLLRQWDGDMRGDRPEPLLLTAWVYTLKHALFSPSLGADLDRYRGLHADSMLKILHGESQYSWCGTSPSLSQAPQQAPTKTPTASPTDHLERSLPPASAPDCQRLLISSFVDTVTSLEKEFGDTPQSWRWDDAHQAHFSHPLFRYIPVLDSLTARSVKTDGGVETINRAAVSGDKTKSAQTWHQRLADRHGPGFRMVIDLANHHDVRVSLAGGQSGNPFSPHYDDLLPLWQRGQAISINQEDAPRDVLILEPGQDIR